MSETNWILPADAINELQQDSIKELVEAAKRAHFCDVVLRIQGEDVRFEADWLKWLEPRP